ncbi:MAG TPA: transaldolase [Steroidobacteraceae bacterium]|nr:transaldolase [Steroidobacteraceae bacterium]
MIANTQRLHDLGQSLWLDNITRALLDGGTLRRYVEQLSVTGLTSNPTIFDEAIAGTGDYDAAIRGRARAGQGVEDLFVEIALEDLRRAADTFKAVHAASGGADGWVSMEVSPLLADDAAATLAAAKRIHGMADRPNLYVKIPGTPAGIQAIEEAIFSGVPINVTLLFSQQQYLAAAAAYMRGIERRIGAGLDPRIASVASLFVSRWDRAVVGRVAAPLEQGLGIAVARRCYRAYRELLASARWRALAAAGAQPQRLLFASTGVKDPQARPSTYVEALAAPGTINTMPEKTLLAFAADGRLGGVLADDGGDAEEVIARYTRAGIDVEALGVKLQHEGAQAFVASWQDLMGKIAAKSAALEGR